MSRVRLGAVGYLNARPLVFGLERSPEPELRPQQPDLETMLSSADAALVIGDNALVWNPTSVNVRDADSGQPRPMAVEKIDLGSVWTNTTGLPFVYAFWAGREGALTNVQVAALQRARVEGEQHVSQIAADYFADAPHHRALGDAYLRDNIRYDLGADERA